MMGGPPGAGPGVNDLVVPHATLKVSNIPSFVTQSDFSRLMTQLEGCVDARLLGRSAHPAGCRARLWAALDPLDQDECTVSGFGSTL